MIREEISDNIIQQTQLLKENKNQQKDLSKHFDCIKIPYNQFMVGGDTNIGNVMFNNVARLALENFNRSCENYIDKLSLSNVEDIIIPSEEEHIEMFPLDFEEFLWAMGDESTFPLIKNCFDKKMPLGNGLHRKIMNDFRQYVLVGGMPQSVNAY